ncbi:tryptophan-rich sensory protein [bacterium]|nr:tryptophan-rich sensory protein [bacterium]NBW57941.1 tryptophan-rich sensory protein [bacterium]NBX72411.1 tryptophan-rich sensory protein [bacterium]
MHHYRSKIIGALFCLSLGTLSGLSMGYADLTWYHQLHKPSFNPPGWIFGPVWTTLYIMMGIVLGDLWNDRASSKKVLWIFAVQMILNVLWSPLFFYMHRIDLALYDIILLWIFIGSLIANITKWSSKLFLVPYFLWVSFACVLNVSLYVMN